jgi:phospholipid transport system substrate-binding protein
MKRYLFATLILATSWVAAPAQTAAATVAGSSTAFISSLGKAVVDVLENPDLSQGERVERYSAQFDRAFDWNRISAFAIGQYRRGVTRDKFNTYRDLFARHMTRLYAERFAHYSGERFLVKGERQFGRGGSEVTALLQRSDDRAPVKLAFKLVRDGDGPRIFDVAIDGVSLLVAKRAEIKSILATGGIDGLIAQLKKANES